jgi:TonB-linked SusC/RagA family outer membrane protein
MENNQKKGKRSVRLLRVFPKILVSMLFVLTAVGAMAQGQSVSGVIVDKRTNEVVIGANVMVEGTTNGTITDIGGNFSLSGVASDASLKVSYLGYHSQTIPVAGKTTFRIALEEDTRTLEEVVVWGYGVQKKSDATGAMTSVGAKEIESRPVTNALQAMQGKAAGVDITSNERPGELGSVRVRGVRSVTASNDPLYVVDGIPLMSSSAIETLNPRDIESIDVLKDASATAIYGSRGANGVIIVTTKKGKDGRLTINYSGTLTVENIYDKSKMMNAGEYVTWRRWAAYNAGMITDPGDAPTIASDQAIFKNDETAWNNIMRGWKSGAWDGSQMVSTDWTDFVTQTGITQEHTLSASGGTDKAQAYASFGYLNNEGTIKGQAYERYTTKISADITPAKWFKMGGSINATWSEQDYGFTYGSTASNLYEAAARIYSYALPYDEDGNMIQYPGGETNVITIINELDSYTTTRQTLRALGSFYAQLDFGEMLPVLKGLQYRTNFGPDFRHRRSGQYVDAASLTRAGAGTSYASLENARDFSWTFDNMLIYNNTFAAKHDVGLTLLHTASKWNIENSWMHGSGVERPEYLWNAFGTIDISDVNNKVEISSGIENRQLESYMFRFNYGFNSRYLLTASGRWDGASQLAEGNKWTFFPSAALAWRIEQESFMENVNWINQLKLRVGVGSTGNSAVAPYQTLGSIQSLYIPFDSNTLGYTTNEPNYTGNQVSMANKKLGWEVTTQYNLGIDFSVLQGRISGAIDGYVSHTKDLLFEIRIPTLSGYPRTIANIGNTSNRGVDITLNTVNVQTKAFEWNTNISFAYTKDKIEKLANGKTDDVANYFFIGKPISVIYDIANDGLWTNSEQDLAEMEKFNANGHNFKTGMVKPVDRDDNYKIDAEDRVILGNTRPSTTLGMSNTFTYKGIELSFMMYGRFGYMIKTNGELQTGRYNQRSISYWTPSNTNADYQMPIYKESGGDAYSALLGYKDANFLKMRNISLGYIFPKKITEKVGLSNLKVYAQATNPFTIYSSIDFRDLDLNTSYYNRGFVFGLDVSF